MVAFMDVRPQTGTIGHLCFTHHKSPTYLCFTHHLAVTKVRKVSFDIFRHFLVLLTTDLSGNTD